MTIVILNGVLCHKALRLYALTMSSYRAALIKEATTYGYTVLGLYYVITYKLINVDKIHMYLLCNQGPVSNFITFTGSL